MAREGEGEWKKEEVGMKRKEGAEKRLQAGMLRLPSSELRRALRQAQLHVSPGQLSGNVEGNKAGIFHTTVSATTEIIVVPCF